MPKYQIPEERINLKENILQCIANELAEANRLKRLELSHFLSMKVARGDMIKSDTLLPKDLEDQA